MKKRYQNKIQEQVDLTLDAFHTDEPPEMDPWFYDRLKNRIDHKLDENTPTIESWWSRALKPGMLLGLVALNLIMMVWIATPSETTASGRSDYIENLSSQYGLNYADTYLLSSEGE